MTTEDSASTGREVEGTRSQRVLAWLRKRSDSPVGRLALEWFRAYFAASRNSGCAIAIYSSLSVFPAALVFVAAVYAAGGDVNVFAQNLVNHLNLTGGTAKLVEDTFGSASSNALAATVAMIVNFLLWGIGIGELYQSVYAKAWGISVHSLADQLLYTIFFFVLAAALGLSMIAQAEMGATGRWAVFTTAWILGSLTLWLGMPYFLLHRRIGLRRLFPGALLAALVLGGTAAFSPLFLSSALTTYGTTFGYFGVSLTIVGYFFIVVTLSLVCAVFSPVWFKWREAEKTHGENAKS